jgi:hypothetical protein
MEIVKETSYRVLWQWYRLEDFDEVEVSKIREDMYRKGWEYVDSEVQTDEDGITELIGYKYSEI